jgi:hypothetical protein
MTVPGYMFLDFDSGLAPIIFLHITNMHTVLFPSCIIKIIAQYHKANSRMRDCSVALFGYGKNQSNQASRNQDLGHLSHSAEMAMGRGFF